MGNTNQLFLTGYWQIYIFRFLYRKLVMKCRNRSANKLRTSHWWKSVVRNQSFRDDQLMYFIMSSATFEYICDSLRQSIESKSNPLSKINIIYSVEKTMAKAIYFLIFADYRVVGNQFTVHQSAINEVIHEFVEACNGIWASRHTKMPDSSEYLAGATFFEQQSKMSYIIGTVDWAHIPILSPTEGYRDFINRKCWAPLAKIFWISYDAAVLKTSKLFRYVDQMIPWVNKTDWPHCFFLIGMITGYNTTWRQATSIGINLEIQPIR